MTRLEDPANCGHGEFIGRRVPVAGEEGTVGADTNVTGYQQHQQR